MYCISILLVLVTVHCLFCIELDQPPVMVVKPGETFTIACKITGYSASGGGYTNWIRHSSGKPMEWIGYFYSSSSNHVTDSLKNKISFSSESSSNTVILTGKNFNTEDTAVYYCARNDGGWGPFGYWGKGTTVTVTSAETSPPKSIFAMSQCTADSDGFVTVGCMTRGFSPADALTFKWTDFTKKDVSFVQYPAFGREGEYTKISHMRVRKSDLDPKKPYKCEASNIKGKKEIDIPLPPPLPPPDVRAKVYLTVPTKTELDNATATFMCLAQRFSPKTYTFKWSLDGNEVTTVIDKCDKSEKKGSVTEYSATSILQISANDWKPNSKIKCEFVHKAGNEEKEAEFPATITECNEIAVDIVPPSLEAMLKNRTGVLKCKASAESPGFSKITITANDNVIAETEVKGNAINVELDAPIGYEEWSNGTEFTCTVEHSELAEPKMSKFVRENGKTPKKPTVFILAPPEHTPGEPMTLTCYVKDFYPKEVFVSWLADDEPVTSKYSTSLPIQKDQLFSVYSQLTVNGSKWKDGTVFSCVVYHEGIDEKMRVLARSINDYTDKAGVINLNMNTPCKA